MELEFNHLGLATKNLERSKRVFAALGYDLGEVHRVPVQGVQVCFATKLGHPTVELIEPMGEDSPVRTILDKCGSGPYHLCYTTRDLDASVASLAAQKFRPVGPVFVSNALNDQRTCFLYNANAGIIEITEEP